jgi:DNA-binding PadR family transcriptional regulator
MSEPALLALLLRYPDPVAIARRVSGASLQPGLRRLEQRGYVIRRRGAYRVTRRGRAELELTRALCAATLRAA